MNEKTKKVWAMYFSPTGTTQKVATAVARHLKDGLQLDMEIFDFTLPQIRQQEKTFTEQDLVVFATPTYAGRVPNVLLTYLSTVKGNGALAIPLVLYGNRNFDDSLTELSTILEQNGFHTIAAAAFIGEHSFSKSLGKERPDKQDMDVVETFSQAVLQKLNETPDILSFSPVAVAGETPIRGYYQPRDRQGKPIDIRKVKPLTKDSCTDCKLCAEICPMGSISHSNVREYTGICIKCGACIKRCPMNAKYYEDEGYLYHKEELEIEYERRAEPVYFV